MIALLLALALEPPAPAASTPAPAPATAPAEPAPAEPPADYQPGWDESAPPPATTVTTTPVPPPTPTTVPHDAPPTEQQQREAAADRREGKGLLIGAGVAAGVGLVANAVRVYTVTGPCQTDSQAFCTGPWVFSTLFAWGPNLASIALAGVGGDLRGRWVATHHPERHRMRARGATIAGATLLGIGTVASILLRVGWFTDWLSPEGRELFDFARPGQAIAYYGGLQVSSMMMATGVGMLSYGGARPRQRKLSLAPMGMGMQLSGRF